MTEQLIIFDTHLRDGETEPRGLHDQGRESPNRPSARAPACSVIEAGFAAASPGDFEAVRAVAESIKDSTVCSLARATEKDIRTAGEAVAPAAKKRIHTFIATSPIHMEKKLRMSPDQVVEAAVAAVKFAGQFTDDVEFFR